MSDLAGEAPSPAEGRPSLSRNVAARFVAEAAGLALGAITAVITARLLGPSVKGVMSALAFVTALIAHACLFGLHDAAVVRVGAGHATAQEALSSSLGVTLLTSIAGSAALLAYAWLQLPMDEPYVAAATAVGCVSLPVIVAGLVLVGILNTQERVVSSSAIFLSITATAAVATTLFIGILDWSVFGGMLGGLVGLLVGLVAAAVLLHRGGLRFRPRLDGRYVRPALRFGIGVQASYMLTVAVARLDLLLVYWLAGPADAGVYSIALTFGTLSGTVAIALSYASFPRLPQLEEAAAAELTVRLVRTGLAAALVVAGLAGAAVPVLTGFVLGPGYAGAAVPSLLLLVGGVLWSGQWLLARAYAARGNTSMQFVSFLANLVSMLALDVVLVPRWESTGAAIASVVGPAVGLAICLRWHRGQSGMGLVALLPRMEEFRQLTAFVRRPLQTH